jgi:hypothetical protein
LALRSENVRTATGSLLMPLSPPRLLPILAVAPPRAEDRI